MWLGDKKAFSCRDVASVLVLLAFVGSLAGAGTSFAQSLSPNFLPAGAPLPKEAPASAPARYGIPETNRPIRADLPNEIPSQHPSREVQYFQPGRTPSPPAADQPISPQQSAAPLRYSAQLPNATSQQAYPAEQQIAAQRYAEQQQQAAQPVAASPAGPAVQSSLPPYQIREMEHQRAYERQMMRHDSASNPASAPMIPPATQPGYNPALADQSKSSADDWHRPVPSGATIRVSSANSSGGSRYSHSQPATSPSSAPEGNAVNPDPSHNTEQLARPMGSGGQTEHSASASTIRPQQTAQEGTRITSPGESVLQQSRNTAITSGTNVDPKISDGISEGAHVQQTDAKGASKAPESTQSGGTSEGAFPLAELQPQIQQHAKELKSNTNLEEQVKTDALPTLKDASERQAGDARARTEAAHPALKALAERNAGGNVTVTMVKQPVPTPLTHLILSLAIFQITLLAGQNLPGLLEIAVLNRLQIDRRGCYAVSFLCRYALTVMGFMLGFKMAGLTWNSVQWLVAAMTVGLGFALQEIFANFVSGRMILFERPVRAGDLVTIGGVTGAIDQRFREAKIEIAFPQQEPTIESIAPILPFLQEPSPATEELPILTKQRAA